MSSDHGRAAMERAIMAGLVPEEGARAGTGLRRLLGKPPHRLPSPEYAGHLIARDIEGRLDRLELCAPLLPGPFIAIAQLVHHAAVLRIVEGQGRKVGGA